MELITANYTRMELSSYENITSPSNTQIHGLPSNLYNSRDELTHVIWSWEEDKIFENSLAEFGIDSQLLLPSLALRLPSKSVLEIKRHFKLLVEDIRMIESGLVEILNSEVRDDKRKASQAMNEGSKRENKSSQIKSEAYERGQNGSAGGNRKKGIPWTKNEHNLFIEGLKRYGKGDWKSISRYCVKTKTATQVASHAQKYFLKLKNPKAPEESMTTVQNSFVGEVPSLSFK